MPVAQSAARRSNYVVEDRSAVALVPSLGKLILNLDVQDDLFHHGITVLDQKVGDAAA